MSTYKVRSWLKQGVAPAHRRPQGHESLFDPYAAYVLDRWRAGVQDGKQLYEEIRQRGYAGSLRLVWAFLQPLREQPNRAMEVVPSSPVEQFCARDAVWLFIREQSKLTVEEQEELLHIRSASGTIETAYELAQQFLAMVRKRQGERLDTWIEAVRASQIPELGRFANGILQDKDAVVTGLTEIFSNGQTEGQVNKLKLLKRSMFGRAKLPLLKQRLLHPFSSFIEYSLHVLLLLFAVLLSQDFLQQRLFTLCVNERIRCRPFGTASCGMLGCVLLGKRLLTTENRWRRMTPNFLIDTFVPRETTMKASVSQLIGEPLQRIVFP